MSWGNKGGWQSGSGGGSSGGDGGGPWGRPSGGGSHGGGGGGGSGGPTPPDFEDMLRASKDRFKDYFGPGGGKGSSKKSIVLLSLGAVLLWFSTGIYKVERDQQGVVMRFGQFHRTSEPGLNYHLPVPIETVFTPSVTNINRVEVGYISSGEGRSASELSVPQESIMLTGDENLAEVTFEVQWKIQDATDFLFNVRNPEATVKAVAESAMREVISNTPVAKALAEGKTQVAIDARRIAQEVLDRYDAGIEITNLNLKNVLFPAEVREAFSDVQSAMADQERLKLEAEAYRNDIIPRAKGQAEQMIQQAEGYKESVVAEASGDAARFNAIYAEYKMAPEVTKKRIYLETMERIMQGMDKVIVDGKSGSTQGVLPYLPLPEMKPKKTPVEGQ